MTAAASNSQSKVIFINRYFFPDQSATSQLLSDLSVGLSRRGFTVHVLCSRQRYDQPQANLPAFEIIEGVIVHRVWTTRFGRDRLTGRALDYLTFYLSSAWRLLKILRKQDTVVAKTDPPLISIVAMIAAKAKGARLINWLQDIFPEVATHLGNNPLPRPIDAMVRRLRDSTLRAAQMNIVLGRRMCEFTRQLGISAERICIIENWADIDRGAPVAAGDCALRAQLGLEGKFVVGYSGNLGRAHEFQTVLAAAALLAPDPDIVFLMIGGGVGMTALKRAVERLGMSNFRFLPYQPRAALPDSLAAADLHWVSLLPALEGLIVPSKAYGILASGRPLIFIGDPDGEIGRLIGPANVGVSVAVGDGPGLARQLAALKSDSGRRECMGRNAFLLYQDRYTANRAIARWCDVLGAVTPSHRPGIHVHSGGQSG